MVLYDESSSESLTENDKAELENAKSRVPKMLAEPSSDNNGLMPRPDGKSVVMDNTLPSSVKSLPKRRTVKAIKL